MKKFLLTVILVLGLTASIDGNGIKNINNNLHNVDNRGVKLSTLNIIKKYDIIETLPTLTDIYLRDTTDIKDSVKITIIDLLK